MAKIRVKRKQNPSATGVVAPEQAGDFSKRDLDTFERIAKNKSFTPEDRKREANKYVEDLALKTFISRMQYAGVEPSFNEFKNTDKARVAGGQLESMRRQGASREEMFSFMTKVYPPARNKFGRHRKRIRKNLEETLDPAYIEFISTF